MHLSVTHFGDDVNASLALGNVEGGSIEVPEAFGKWLELLGILHERLHLFLASHRAEETKYAVNRGR